jgi:GTP:adenosylcobinamide-phosphate guanylyltransferase
MDGVTLLGIKALENKTSKLMRELNKLKELEINTKEDFQGIEKRIEVLEQKLLH